MITQNVTLSSTQEGKIQKKREQNCNPGLALIGLSGTGLRPRKKSLLVVRYKQILFVGKVTFRAYLSIRQGPNQSSSNKIINCETSKKWPQASKV